MDCLGSPVCPSFVSTWKLAPASTKARTTYSCTDTRTLRSAVLTVVDWMHTNTRTHTRKKYCEPLMAAVLNLHQFAMCVYSTCRGYMAFQGSEVEGIHAVGRLLRKRTEEFFGWESFELAE